MEQMFPWLLLEQLFQEVLSGQPTNGNLAFSTGLEPSTKWSIDEYFSCCYLLFLDKQKIADFVQLVVYIVKLQS